MAGYFAENQDGDFLHTQSQKIFRELIESVKCGVYMANMQGDLFFVNQAFVNMLGYQTQREMKGLNLADLLFSNPDEKEEFLKSMEKTGFTRDYEIKAFRRDGSPVVLSATSNIIRNDGGKIVGVEGIVQDITEKKALERELNTEKSKFEQIFEFDQKINTIHKLDDLANFIVEKTTQILNADKCSLMLMDNDSNELCIKSAKGLSEDIISSVRVKLGDPIAGMVAQSDEPLLVKNIEYDKAFERKSRSSYLSRSFMSVSIRKDNKLIGVVNVTDKNVDDGGVFTELDLKILCMIVRQAAITIENAKLYSELEYLSKTDPVTNLRNYRGFVRSLEREIKRLKRSPGMLSLLMIDIDNFKEVNDTLGHVEGDKFLKKIGKIFEDNLRSADRVCRYGGDEFVIILPGTDLDQARITAEKLRRKVEEHSFKSKVSLSVGVAEYTPELSRVDLTLRADKALYQAKNEGRNRIIVYQEK